MTTTLFDRRGIEAQLTAFIVVGPGYWGKGKDLKEALANARKQSSTTFAKDTKIAFWGDDSITVTAYGDVVANKAMLRIGEL